METYGFRLEFRVPDEVDIGGSLPAGGTVFFDAAAETPALKAVESAVIADNRWNFLRAHGQSPTLYVCVTVTAPNEGEARSMVQGGVHDVVTEAIPSARFVRIDATDPNPQ